MKRGKYTLRLSKDIKLNREQQMFLRDRAGAFVDGFHSLYQIASEAYLQGIRDTLDALEHQKEQQNASHD